MVFFLKLIEILQIKQNTTIFRYTICLIYFEITKCYIHVWTRMLRGSLISENNSREAIGITARSNIIPRRVKNIYTWALSVLFHIITFFLWNCVVLVQRLSTSYLQLLIVMFDSDFRFTHTVLKPLKIEIRQIPSTKHLNVLRRSHYYPYALYFVVYNK